MPQLLPVVEAKRQSQVMEQTSNLESSLNVLHDRIDSLPDRLSSVLSSSKPPTKGEDRDSVELVALASTIQDFDDSVKSAIYKMKDLLDRIEL